MMNTFFVHMYNYIALHFSSVHVVEIPRRQPLASTDLRGGQGPSVNKRGKAPVGPRQDRHKTSDNRHPQSRCSQRCKVKEIRSDKKAENQCWQIMMDEQCTAHREKGKIVQGVAAQEKPTGELQLATSAKSKDLDTSSQKELIDNQNGKRNPNTSEPDDPGNHVPYEIDLRVFIVHPETDSTLHQRP